MPLGLGQNEPTEVNAPRDLGQQKRSDTGGMTKQPIAEQDRIRYGIITAVNDASLVKVKLLGNDGLAVGDDINDGKFLPLMNPLSEIFLLWGSLRKGLICRVFWRGKLEPNNSTVIEVIADEDHNFLKKPVQSNELGIGPYRIFMGGVTP